MSVMQNARTQVNMETHSDQRNTKKDFIYQSLEGKKVSFISKKKKPTTLKSLDFDYFFSFESQEQQINFNSQ